MIATGQINQGLNKTGKCRMLWLAAVISLMALPAAAENVLKDIRYTAGAGGKVDITFEFDKPIGDVQAFTTEVPPRIAMDFAQTANSYDKRRLAVGSGATAAVSAVEAGDRTRVVVDLFRPAGYTTRSAGNQLVLTVEGGASLAKATETAMSNPSDPTKRPAGALKIANIDFKRAENGAGRVIFRFNESGAMADMRDDNGNIIVDVSNASLPAELQRRLDVRDFATPVKSVEPRSNGGGSRFVIAADGKFDTSAYQTGNEYIVEVTPKAAPGNGKAVGAPGTGLQPQRYTGRPVTFNFQDVPVRTVLQLIAEETNLNIVAADTVQGNVTLRLINVPWDQALDIVLRAKSLDKRKDGNVIWVAPQKEIADFEQAREDARIALENRTELVTEYIPINYGNAQAIASLLTDESKRSQGGGAQGSSQQQSTGFLSPRGSISFDQRTNTLLVIDIPKKIEEIRSLVQLLDRPVDQVLIEARIVIANESFNRELGARFGVSNLDRNLSSNGGTGAISGNLDSNLDTINSFNDAVSVGPDGSLSVGRYEITRGLMTDLPVTNAAGAFALSILRSSHLIDIELSALEEEQRGEVVANPRVITANQREAIIKQGDEIGFVTVQAGQGVATQTVQFKEALLELKVTPTITQDNRVFLNMAVKKDELAGFVQTNAGNVPQITKREVNTAVLIENGQTVVIGGVYEFESREDLRKVPFLGDLPVLGNLFRNKGRNNEKAELLIFVTPRILQVAGTRSR